MCKISKQKEREIALFNLMNKSGMLKSVYSLGLPENEHVEWNKDYDSTYVYNIFHNHPDVKRIVKSKQKYVKHKVERLKIIYYVILSIPQYERKVVTIERYSDLPEELLYIK